MRDLTKRTAAAYSLPHCYYRGHRLFWVALFFMNIFSYLFLDSYFGVLFALHFILSRSLNPIRLSFRLSFFISLSFRRVLCVDVWVSELVVLFRLLCACSAGEGSVRLNVARHEAQQCPTARSLFSQKHMTAPHYGHCYRNKTSFFPTEQELLYQCK